MDLDYITKPVNYKAVAEFFTACQKEQMRQLPENAEQMECIIEESLATFVKKHKEFATQEFRDAVYRVYDAMLFGSMLLGAVESLKRSYEEDYLPSERSVIAGLHYAAAYYSQRKERDSPLKEDYFSREDMKKSLEVFQDVAELSNRNQKQFEKVFPKEYH